MGASNVGTMKKSRFSENDICKIEPQLLWNANMKPHSHFQMVWFERP